MATENGPDLTYARQQVEQLMDDRCRIVRTLDQGQQVYPAAGVDGPCTIKRASTGRGTALRGDDEYVYPYTASVTIDLVDVEEGDEFTLTSSRRDPWLAGRTWIVRGVEGGTFSLTRKLYLDDDEPARRYEEVGP